MAISTHPLNAAPLVPDGPVIWEGRVRDAVAIVGPPDPGAPPPPLSDAMWEVWGFNACVQGLYDAQGRLRADRWFQLHPAVSLSDAERQWGPMCPIPTYVLSREEGRAIGVQRPLVFPLGLVTHLTSFPVFPCTMAYQVALALALGFTTLALYGIDLPSGTIRERTVEWAGLAYWLGVAEGRGVTVRVPGASRLLYHPYRYGYDYHAERADVRTYARQTLQAGTCQGREILDDGDY